MKHDYIVYGTGLSSKLLSLSLAKSGFKVLIIHDKEDTLKETNLVTFVSEGSLKYISKILQTSEPFPESEKIDKLYCEHHNNNKKSKLVFNDDKNYSLGKIVPNKIIDKLLANEMKQYNELITIIDEKNNLPKIIKSGVEFLENNGTVHSSNLLFYCSSRKNNQIINKFEFVHKDIHQEALSIDAEVNRLKKNTAYQIFTTDGPVALLPIRENQASFVWSLKKNSKIINLENNKLSKVLNSLFDNQVADIKVNNVETHVLKFSYAKKLYANRCALIGNIAHNIHPIAGQGFNLSIKDISAIVKDLENYRSIGLDLGSEQVLEKFSIKRKFDNFAFSFGTLAMENIFSNKNKVLRYLTNKSFSLLERNRKIKSFFINRATGKYDF